MSADDDVRDLQDLHGIFNGARLGEIPGREPVGRGGRNQIADIAHGEELTRIGRSQQVGRDPAVGAGDEQRIGRLSVGELAEVLGVSRQLFLAELDDPQINLRIGPQCRCRPTPATWMAPRRTVAAPGSLLGRLPQYQTIKSMAEGLAQLQNARGIKVALISGWQIGYVIEPLENGWLSVFLPQAPTPMSGNVMYFPADRVRPFQYQMVEAMAMVKRIGVGIRRGASRR
jgi:hypothetical protein